MGELTSFCSDPLSRILLGDSAGFSGGTKEAMPARRKEAPSAAAGSSSKSPAASPKLAPKKAKGSKAKSAAKKPVEVHRCRFVEWVPEAVQVARFSPDGQHLAVAREDAGIELWVQDEGWRLERRIMGHKERSVTGLAWCGGRLFSVGTHGQVTEWDLDSLSPRLVEDSYGGAVWCCVPDHAGERLALGCEDGSVRIFDVTDDSLTYSKVLDGQQGRVLSLAWTLDDESLFSGQQHARSCTWPAFF